MYVSASDSMVGNSLVVAFASRGRPSKEPKQVKVLSSTLKSFTAYALDEM